MRYSRYPVLSLHRLIRVTGVPGNCPFEFPFKPEGISRLRMLPLPRAFPTTNNPPSLANNYQQSTDFPRVTWKPPAPSLFCFCISACIARPSCCNHIEPQQPRSQPPFLYYLHDQLASWGQTPKPPASLRSSPDPLEFLQLLLRLKSIDSFCWRKEGERDRLQRALAMSLCPS